MAHSNENEIRSVPPSPEMRAGISPELEQHVRAVTTPERARLIAFAAISSIRRSPGRFIHDIEQRLHAFAATKQTAFLSPRPHHLAPELEECLELASPADLPDNLPFAAGEQVSEQRRKEYWEEGERGRLSFAEQNKQWNEGLHTTIRHLTTPPEDTDQQKIQKAEIAKETLQHLGLTGAGDTQDKPFTSAQKGSQIVTLYSDIETFRQTYFAEKSDIEGFVKKIAEQCTRGNGTVDVPLLTKRLAAIKLVLVSFGDQSVDSLVEDYAVCYGLLTQAEAPIRKKIVRETTSKLQTEITDPLKKGRYEAVIKRQEEMDREEPQRQQPRGEPAQPTQVFPQPLTASEQRREEDEPGRREPVNEPTPGVQPETQVQQPENGEIARKVAHIEEKLKERLGREIALSPRQKAAMPIMPHGEWRGGWYGYKGTLTPVTDSEYIEIYVDQYRRLQGEGLPHDEIVQELEKILRPGNFLISEDGKALDIGYLEIDPEDGAMLTVGQLYPRKP